MCIQQEQENRMNGRMPPQTPLDDKNKLVNKSLCLLDFSYLGLGIAVPLSSALNIYY